MASFFCHVVGVAKQVGLNELLAVIDRCLSGDSGGDDSIDLLLWLSRHNASQQNLNPVGAERLERGLKAGDSLTEGKRWLYRRYDRWCF